MMTPILATRDLMKRYGKTQALARWWRCWVPTGRKTTFVRAVATLLALSWSSSTEPSAYVRQEMPPK